MNEDNKPVEVEKVECMVSLKEVPVSEAKSEEATDYVLHFCGLECYTKWQIQDQKQKS